MGFWYLYVYSGDWDSSLTLQCDILYASSITFVYMRTGAQGARHRTLKMQYDPEAIVTHYAGTAGKDADSFDPSGKYTIKKQGAFAAVEATVSHGDEVMSDSGAMVSMSNNIDLAVKLHGGAGAAFCRSCCAGESAFFSFFTLEPGQGDRGDIMLAPAVPGELMLLQLQGQMQWCIQKGAFLCADTSIDIGVKTQSFAQGCCSGEGFFILRAGGEGRLIVNSYGSIIRYDLAPGEVRVIDTGYLVCWTDNMEYKISKASKSWWSTIMSGEGFVNKFVGPGTIFVQTRCLKALAGALIPYLPSTGGAGGESSGGDS
mmetsp:Transcript_37380/g.97016  ORF Transcript_37380/g.97016 Transcript_37380/m.97016 type:complete len:315 (+) Transcript_37380:293-1237(+)